MTSVIWLERILRESHLLLVSANRTDSSRGDLLIVLLIPARNGICQDHEQDHDQEQEWDATSRAPCN